MINRLTLKNPAQLVAGFFFILSLVSCQSVETPEQVTLAFWSAMASKDFELAKKYSHSQNVALANTELLKESTFSYGKIVINNKQASVQTFILSPDNRKTSFTTYLINEDKLWKVDYQRSATDLASNHFFSKLFQDLNSLGKTWGEQLEQQIPAIEKEIKSFAKELEQQLDNFGNTLKKTFPQKQNNPYQDTI